MTLYKIHRGRRYNAADSKCYGLGLFEDDDWDDDIKLVHPLKICRGANSISSNREPISTN